MKFILKLFVFVAILSLLWVYITYYKFWTVSCLKFSTIKVLKPYFVIGIGLPRTGSSSLTKALQILNYSTHHFPLHFFQKEMLYRTRKNALLDWVTLGFRPTQLVSLFPNAKFIYTRRSFTKWYKSMIHLEKLLFLLPYIRKQFHLLFGPRTNWQKFYNDYTSEIEQVKKNIVLLDWDLTENPQFEPLCQFLNEPNPLCQFPNIKEVKLQLQQIYK